MSPLPESSAAEQTDGIVAKAKAQKRASLGFKTAKGWRLHGAPFPKAEPQQRVS
ncbi:MULTISPECIES: hypothetical protein [Methylobacteriaceae]|uniref:hypothetical protein n=1 Tax=Methylobacteriaceae TaxID=119045 RepID=UPI002F350143